MHTQDNREPKAKPFPWFCPRCGKQQVIPDQVAYTIKVNHDGVLHSVHLPQLRVPRCVSCGDLLFEDQADDQISAALRAQLDLLTPEQITQNRQALGLSRKELADRLGVAEKMLAKWEDKFRIQSRSEDNLLRLYFALPDVRRALLGGQNPQLGASVDLHSTVVG